METVLVTGGTGSFGSTLVKSLLNKKNVKQNYYYVMLLLTACRQHDHVRYTKVLHRASQRSGDGWLVL